MNKNKSFFNHKNPRHPRSIIYKIGRLNADNTDDYERRR